MHIDVEITEETLEELPPYTEEEKEKIEKDYQEVRLRIAMPGYEQTLEDQRIIIRHCRAFRETRFYIAKQEEKVKKETKEKKPRKTREKKEVKTSVARLSEQEEQELLMKQLLGEI